MDVVEDVVEEVVENKRPSNNQTTVPTRKSAKDKLKKYASPGTPPSSVGCKHKDKKNAYLCEQLSAKDMADFHEKFYSNVTKIAQDSFLLKYTEATPTKRVRIVKHKREPNQSSFKYFVPIKGKKTRVCQTTFLNTLLLSKNRVLGVLRRHFQSGESPFERRGGNRKGDLYVDRRESVIEFIKRFQCLESHYCREQTLKRDYMRSDLNVNKMWRIYFNEHDDDDLNVTGSFFRVIFRTKFNFGFGNHGTDECSTCLSLTEQIKSTDSAENVQKLVTERDVHVAKSKAFFTLLKTSSPNVFSFSFDCLKNQTLPYVQDQAAYYSTQLYKHNLTIVVGDYEASQTSDNVFIYNWCENQHKKGPNEVSSAVFDFLLNYTNIPLETEKIRCFCNGCSAQNKNSTFIGMLAFWLLTAPRHVKEIEVIYPMVGHSFLPPNMVFERIEEDVKKRSTIFDPSEYVSIFSKQGTTISLAGKVMDFKTALDAIMLSPDQWHFQLSSAKRLLLRRNESEDDVKIKGEMLYTVDMANFMRISKEDRKLEDLQPKMMTIGVTVAPAKINDVDNLLKQHCGDDWRKQEAFSYYQTVIDNNNGDYEEDIRCENADLNENVFI